MNKTKIKQIAFPLIAAMIWGTAFVAQSLGTGHLSTFTFNACRAYVGFFVLLVIILIIRFSGKSKVPVRTKSEKKEYFKDLLLGGLCCGGFMTLASVLQQKGLEFTSPGKAGFITAFYVVIVPIFGLFTGKRAEIKVWLSVIIAIIGIYFLCVTADEGFSLNKGDILVFICAFGFALQIISIDHFVSRVNGIELSCAQFAFMAIFSTIGSLLFETFTLPDITACIPYILYLGIFSSGVAYTLQIMAQKDGNPTVVSLLLCLESFFAVLAEAVILGEKMSGREYFGCAVMLAAIIISQLPSRSKKQ